jgi:fructokinase
MAQSSEASPTSVRIGIDLGGTKIAGIALGSTGEVIAEQRISAPRDSYEATIRAVHGLVTGLDHAGAAYRIQQGLLPTTPSVGIGMPGSVSPVTKLIQGANSTWLNGHPFDRDLAARMGRPVRIANDANCFALSEATDGAAAGAASVFGVIIGTGCGGGIVINGRVLEGARGIAGEWGHNPLPWADAAGYQGEHPGPTCWCGRPGCLETWVSGSGLAADHQRMTGQAATGEQIATAAAAAAGDTVAQSSLDRHASRLARGLAHVVNLFDPDVIVLGGGLSQLPHLYDVLPGLMARWVFSDTPNVIIRPPKWGDASGVRGAAWLWG